MTGINSEMLHWALQSKSQLLDDQTVGDAMAVEYQLSQVPPQNEYIANG